MKSLPQTAIGYIRGHEVAGGFMESLLATVLYDAQVWNIIRGRIIPHHCAHYFNVGRNELTAKLCDKFAGEAEVFVMLDTDHVFNPQQLMHLVALCDPGRPVVSGLYYACDNLGEQVRPLVMQRLPGGALRCQWDFPRDNMIEVDAVGMGFCAIHRDLLLRMRDRAGDHWFDFDENDQDDFMPEDNAFCLRVKEYMGAKIFVHTGIEVGHLKTCELRGGQQKRKPL